MPVPLEFSAPSAAVRGLFCVLPAAAAAFRLARVLLADEDWGYQVVWRAAENAGQRAVPAGEPPVDGGKVLTERRLGYEVGK